MLALVAYFPKVDFLRITLLPFAAIAALLLTAVPLRADIVDVWLGTGTNQPDQGIFHCTLNTENGRLSAPRVVAQIIRPGFLAMHPSQPVLYAVGTLEKTPCVAAYRITATGRNASLELLNFVPIGDGGAAHVAVNDAGTMLTTAQYGGGSVAVFSLQSSGAVGKRTQLVEHGVGSKVVAGRQDTAHAHWVGYSPDQRFLFVPDLGLDKVMIYECDSDGGRIQQHGAGVVPPGAGPRHMKFHQNGQWVYVLNELDLSVTLFRYNKAEGTMTAAQTVATVPKTELAKEKFKSCSEIRVHPNGRYVYAANRGHDTITVFSVHPATGELTVVEREHVRGATPRNFNITPDGRWLLAAGQHSHTLACFEVNPDSGELTYNREVVHAPSCICVLFGHE